MNKKSVITESLKNNPNVIIVKSYGEDYLPGRKYDSDLSQIFEFLVSPKRGLYSVKELQDFMMDLVPEGLEPTSKWDFGETNAYLFYGFLCFDEEIGQEKIIRKCELIDEKLFNVSGFIDGKRIITEEKKPYLRRTLIRPFPDRTIATETYGGKLRKDGISPYKLKQIKNL